MFSFSLNRSSLSIESWVSSLPSPLFLTGAFLSTLGLGFRILRSSFLSVRICARGCNYGGCWPFTGILVSFNRLDRWQKVKFSPDLLARVSAPGWQESAGASARCCLGLAMESRPVPTRPRPLRYASCLLRRNWETRECCGPGVLVFLPGIRLLQLVLPRGGGVCSPDRSHPQRTSPGDRLPPPTHRGKPGADCRGGGRSLPHKEPWSPAPSVLHVLITGLRHL